MSAYRVEPIRPFGAILHAAAAGALPGANADLRALLLRHRLLVFRGFDPFADPRATAEYSAGWGPLLEWSFGTVFEVVEQPAPTNYLFTSGSVPFHWDGAFAQQVPWLQVFQCVESPGPDQGGETLFCDTTLVWQALDAVQRDAWRRIDVEYATDKVAHYGGRIRAPLVGTHPLTGETVIRFNEPANAGTVNLNTPEVTPLGLPASESAAFLADVTARLYDPAVSYAHAWQVGDRVLADNFVLLHGRSPYRSQLPRRLWRVHVLLKEGASS